MTVVQLVKVHEIETRGAAQQVLVRTDEAEPRYFVVSTVIAFDTGKLETLVFKADEEGNIESWSSVAGGIGMNRQKAMVNLHGVLNGTEQDTSFDTFVEEMGGNPLTATFNILNNMGKSPASARKPLDADLEWEE